MKILKCNCCGKEFISEYYFGGYIDHYENFASRYAKYNNNANKIITEICMNGNELRKLDDIKSRLECVLMSKDIEDDCKEDISKNVNLVLKNINRTEEWANDKVLELSKLERLKLIEAAEYNCNKPYVNWRDCL